MITWHKIIEKMPDLIDSKCSKQLLFRSDMGNVTVGVYSANGFWYGFDDRSESGKHTCLPTTMITHWSEINEPEGADEEKCETCRHWTPTRTNYGMNAHRCSKVMEMASIGIWYGGKATTLTVEGDVLITPGDFGCQLHESKESHDA